ncbi:MAG: non-heme iron oxygenase ferredoxin subunit [Actinomycetales bacterium]|nr:non-heme iron oxygenase ferredoxin subunit [Actinomycetales bacterium]
MSAVRVCALDDLDEVGALRVVVAGEPIAVVRDEEGHLHAIDDTCTHAQVSLSEGEVEGCTIECWVHGSRFDLRTGQPLSLPATRPVAVYAVTVEGDDVLVDVTHPINQSPTSASNGADKAAVVKES